jgi:hypothetical protein
MLIETTVGTAVLAIGFLGTFAIALQAGRMAAAAEDESRVSSGLEQRIDQLRLLTWTELTDGTGITGTVWKARPGPTTGMTITQETITLSPWDLAGAKTLSANWTGTSSPTVTFNAGTQPLGNAFAVKVVATITWDDRLTLRSKTRSLVTVVSRGGISKSALP